MRVNIKSAMNLIAITRSLIHKRILFRIKSRNALYVLDLICCNAFILL